MSVNLITGLSDHPASVAQLGASALIANGHDASKILDLRTLSVRDFFSAPVAPTGAANGAGILNATYTWRVRWVDASTGAVSLPSAIYSATPANQTWRITQPAGAPTRATHWIVERNTNGGLLYYPVNVSSAAPNGTAIATGTVDDNTPDSTLNQLNVLAFPDTQGNPRRFPVVFSNGNFLHQLGVAIHQMSASLANGANAITSADGDFTADMVGKDFSFDADTDGVTYKITGYTNANAISIAPVTYAGVTKVAQPASIAGPGDITAWCEPGQPEWWGKVLTSGYSQNEAIVGEDGARLIAGAPLGPLGVALAKESRLFIHNYRVHPSPAVLGGDGNIVPMQRRRGASGPRAMRFWENYIYGMDLLGVWRAKAGEEADEIGEEIAKDWRALNFTKRANFHIAFDGLLKLAYFFVCEGTDTYPKASFVWDLTREAWIDKVPWPWGVTASCEMRDTKGAMRMVVYNDVTGPGSGALTAYPWFANIGTALGAPPAASNLTGSVTAGGAASLTNSGAAWPTSGAGLNSVPVKLIRAADASEETAIIRSNTATVLTTTAWVGSAPVAGDTYIIGGIEASWKTGRIDCGEPKRRKLFKRAYLRLVDDATAIILKARVYYNGSSTAFSDWARTQTNEDGIAFTTALAPVTVTPTADKLRYYVPLGHKWANDVQIEIYSDRPGAAWQILPPLEIEYDLDQSGDPRKD